MPGAFAVDGEVAPAVGALDVDVVFPLLHGPYGEDGTVQGLLELADLPYVGSGVVGSAVAMDKVMMKRAFAAAGLPYARTVAFRDGHDRDALADAGRGRAGLPVLREAGQPRLVGRRVEGARPRRRSTPPVDLALSYDEWIVVEEAITGREIELGVLGDDPPTVSVPGEIVPGDEFYSYADKYEADDAELLVPAPLTDDQVAEAQAARLPGVRGVPVRGDGPRRPVPRGATARLPGERGQHDPRVHADLDVPAPVGGDRRALRRAARPADRPRARPPRPPRRPGRPPALTRMRWVEVDALQIDDGAGEGAGDAVDLLDLGHDELAELVERVASALTITS